MPPNFSAEQIAELREGRLRVHKQFADLRQSYIVREYKSARAYEYATQGFGRRLGTLVRAIDRVYEVLPPEREDIPQRDEIIDATIAIHSFVVNTYGCLDNLAWIWVLEKGVKGKDGTELEPKNVELGSRILRKSFSNQFKAYLDSRQQWSDNLKDFRDSLAHRIPLYVPPYIVTTAMIDEFNRLEDELQAATRRNDLDEYERIEREQQKLGRFRPWMTHSRIEQAPSILFHPQLVADFATINEFGRTMLRELDR